MSEAAGMTLDAGALIAVETGDRRLSVLIDRAERNGVTVAVPCAALAQVWRDGSDQARLSRLLKRRHVELVPFDKLTAKLVGIICAATGVRDVVDVSVVVCARLRSHRVVTSDVKDMRRIDPKLGLIRV